MVIGLFFPALGTEGMFSHSSHLVDISFFLSFFLSPSIMLELQKVYITTNFLLFPLFTLFSFHFSSYLGDEEVFANVLSQVADKFIRLDKH